MYYQDLNFEQVQHLHKIFAYNYELSIRTSLVLRFYPQFTIDGINQMYQLYLQIKEISRSILSEKSIKLIDGIKNISPQIDKQEFQQLQQLLEQKKQLIVQKLDRINNLRLLYTSKIQTRDFK